MRKTRQIAMQHSSLTKSKASPRLKPADLQEFRLRHAAMTVAAHNQLLVQEAYQSWIKKTLGEYGLSGKYLIDAQTGEFKEIANG